MKNNKYFIISLSIICFIILGLSAYSLCSTNNVTAKPFQLDEQEATILAIKKVIPSVVSVIVYDQVSSITFDASTGEAKINKQKAERGRGTGFIISSDGYIITNKHVVEVANADTGEYKIFLNSGKQYYAQLIGKDTMNDLAVLKIFDKNLPAVELGDSSKLEMGTVVIAIGNALGRYENSATKGIVSALGRSLTATDSSGASESLDNVIQTDAQINPGNSGGPLVNLQGQVIGVNVATESSGSSIGFAIAINDAKPVIKSIKEVGRIVRPRLGVRYITITPAIAQENKLKSDKGAWINNLANDEPSILPGSPADKAGLQKDDIITEVNGIKIEGLNTLFSIIQNYKPRDKIGLRIIRGDKIIIKQVVLEESK